jgi:hypothetical protein
MARKPQSNKIKVAAAEAKYVGSEPVWAEQPAEESRTGALISALNWYNYACDKKQAKEMMLEYLKAAGNADSYKVIKGVADGNLNLTAAWLCRMSTQGFELNENERERISIEVLRHKDTKLKVAEIEEAEDTKPKGPTIQDRMLEKANEAAGELEGILDNFIMNGCKPVKGEDAITVLKVANILPQHISVITDTWEAKLSEFQSAHNGNEEISEYYAGYGKIELRNLVKFAEQVIADALSYVQFKKVAKTPRRKKPVPPEKVVAKLKYQKEFGDIKSEKPVKILGAKEMFVYNTKNRKLQYYVADQHSGGLYVKNNAIIGYDPTQSVMKTLRKPEEQVKELMKASKPNSRKFFADIRAVESKLNGRFAETLVILRVH